METTVNNMSSLCPTDQPEASVCARSVGTLPVRHGSRLVAQRGGAECDRKAGKAADSLQKKTAC